MLEHCWGSRDAEFAWCYSAVLGKSLSIILGFVWSVGEPSIHGRSHSLGGTGSCCASFSSLTAASTAKSSTDVVNPLPGLIPTGGSVSHQPWKSKAPFCLSALPRPQQGAGTLLQEGDLFTLYVGSTGTTWDRDQILGITAAMAGNCKSVLLKATVNILKWCWFFL